jgi:sphingolipid 4-desaturase/C4-monooxygenase
MWGTVVALSKPMSVGWFVAGKPGKARNFKTPRLSLVIVTNVFMLTNMFDEELKQARLQARGPRYSVPRIALDVVMWIGLAWIAEQSGHQWVMWAAIVAIGMIPLHDILVHGHEATHGLVSHSKTVNAFFLWLIHALVFLSGSAYQAFHWEHHRKTLTADDPETLFLSKVVGKATGFSFLLIPVFSQISVTFWPWFHRSKWASPKTVLRDMVAALMLHSALIWGLGSERWLHYVVFPVFTGLSVVVIIRSLCEHHAAIAGDRWTKTRAMETNGLLEFLWSNVNHHLEHHLVPDVPWHNLPKVRKLLAKAYQHKSAIVDRGYLKTSFRLLFEKEHAIQPSCQPSGGEGIHLRFVVLIIFL